MTSKEMNVSKKVVARRDSMIMSSSSSVSSSKIHSIQLACQSMETAVARFIKKQGKRSNPISASNEGRAKKAVKHFQYAVEQLFRKRTSLEFAAQAFGEVCCLDCMQALECLMGKGRCIGTSRISAQQSYSYADQVNVIFSHWMEQFVRLQDCFVLLQSGECRHDTDIELCRTYAFKSQFGRDLLRKDGYTSLYSAKFYSGYGWDELFDEDVGLKSRITLALGGLSKDKQNRIWNDIMDKAPTIDNLLNEFEQSIKTLFQKLETYREKFVQFVKSLIAAHNGVIRLSIVDKMERLEILNAQPLHIKSLRIERQADSFQVQDLGGVLPSAFTYTDWKSKMVLPTSISKIKCGEAKMDDSKLNIESKYIHAGLKTTIKYAIDELKQKSVTAESVNNIKHMMGINAQSLEASRERLEDEVNIGIRENNKQESCEVKKRFREEQSAHEIDEVELIEEVLHFTQELVRNRKQLENEADLDAIWNAKELIREILRTLGLLHIELSNISSQVKYLQDAINYFTEELKMIKELELLLTQDGDDRVTRRRLCTMRGWAHGNLGTAHLNLALSLSTDGGAQQRHFQDSVDQMLLVHHSANAIRAWCDRDKAATAPFRAHQETLIHRICAFELESFANRWRGVALWKLGNLEEASKALDAASACFFHPSGDLNNRVHEAYLSLLVLRCSAAVQFADLAVTEADKCLVACSARKGVDRKQKKDEGIKLITVAIRAYRRGMLILQEMNNVGRKNTMIMREGSNLPTENQIRERITELEERNSQLKATNDANLKNLMDEIHLKPHGNYVPCSMRIAHHQEPPTKLIALKPRLRHKKDLRAVNTATSLPNDFVGPGSDARAPEETASPALKPTQYCKWGDDLLPKSSDGRLLYEYPGCCPPLPSDLQT